jgi:hypothetical protein
MSTAIQNIQKLTQQRLYELQTIRFEQQAARLLEREKPKPEPAEHANQPPACESLGGPPTEREELIASAAYSLMAEDFPNHLTKHKDVISAIVAKAASDLKDQILLELGERITRLIDSKLGDLKSEFAEIVTNLETRLNSTLAEHEDDSRQGLEALESILSRIQPPQVILPTDAIAVNVTSEPSVVHIPENALAVNIAQLAAERPPRKVRKTIEYGPDGRPAAIVEEEIQP